ncbi:MAG TPA: type II secretion system inner membrane protein GspF [Ottowia sp.]|uniref:type II secretion system inner membrane protein GspF n=1 Tax=Ottowia sp. TaxID=1898956 RepID=UPI002C83DE43|nr:type II secretion system inner membrane protein GspF [Ottowia sp.]HNR84876.1 type II secretion system inner membrane protein GspF [Ottowia sp.]HOZ92639.1 type II secretion system inner membrane protein GspF [Ottowia sp.]HQO52252.1 type II secretion system inner membrane protein GspF [Ottowia sp.]HQQ52474.1 type II secretion system inner membrane protein GspF [Ottowia sp.]
MPAYTFEALQADGKSRQGVIEADSARAARALLREQALVPLTVEPVTTGGSVLTRPLGGARAFNASQLAIWTRQLAGLIGAGLPLERALTALVDEAEHERQRHLLAALRAEVNAGAPLARAMAQHPRDFSPVYTAVIAAGEQGGHLGLVLERLADDLEERQTLKAKLIGAALYPAIVTVVAIVIVVFLVSYVVPQVASVFAGSKQALPTLTVLMMALSQFVRAWGGWLLLALGLIAVGARLALQNDGLRQKFDAAWLRLPLIGRLARGYNAARFGATLAMLAGAGVPILRALQAAGETLHNRAMRADAEDALVMVREGAPLAAALAQKPRFPGLLAMFARMGEQTGQLPAMLQRASAQLSAEVQRRALQLATVLEPLLIVVMGVVVLLIVLAVMLPIIQLNQWVR